MAEATREQLGKRIKALRKRAKLNQEDVAEKVGIDAKSLSRIESGRHYPSLETLAAIAEVIGASLKDCFDFPSEPEGEESMRAYLTELSQSLDARKLRLAVTAAREALKDA